MNFKYFLRGLGVGIIFASFICFVAFRGQKPSVLSNEEIIKKAKELGMVEKNSISDKKIESKNTIESTKTTTESQKEEDVNIKSTDNSENGKESDNSDKKEENTTEKEKSETDSKSSDVKNKEEKKDEQKNKKSKVKLNVPSGSSSYPVCQKLESLGLIEDAADFDTYLVENGYANRISVGEHFLEKGMSYYDIAEAISDPLEEE